MARSPLWLCALTMAALIGSPQPGSAREIRRELPDRERNNNELPEKYRKSPYAMMSLSVGLPNAGWQLRARKLHSSAQLWVQDKSVPYTYGHPSLVLMLYRTAKQIAKQSPGSRLLIGDLSREFGGPLSGHKSHQSGRDADVASS